MAPERSGTLSTRTTHPWYLWELERILTGVGAHSRISNPFESKTKGEMFAAVKEKFGASGASTMLGVSYSCARGDLRYSAPADVRHCGICFGCLVRRAAFMRAELVDPTSYFVSVKDPVGAGGGWLTVDRKQDVTVVEYATAKGEIDPADIIAMGLPPTVDVDSAIALAQRGVDELMLLF
jgi:hypothetical protein